MDPKIIENTQNKPQNFNLQEQEIKPQTQIFYQQQQQQNSGNTAPVIKSHIRNSSQNNVQSYLKLNTPVVLNHELLASYGVSLNGNHQQQQHSSVIMSDENNKFKSQKSIRRDDVNSQKVQAPSTFINTPQLIPVQLQNIQNQSIQQPQQQLINSSQVQGDLEKNQKFNNNHVMYTNIGGNVQQMGAVKNSTKSIKLLMNMQQQNINSLNQADQIVQNSNFRADIKPDAQKDNSEPKTDIKQESFQSLNGDNTLLKALLQTAPKNAPSFSQPSQDQLNLKTETIAVNESNQIKLENNSQNSFCAPNTATLNEGPKKKNKSSNKQIKQQMNTATENQKVLKTPGQTKVNMLKLNEGN